MASTVRRKLKTGARLLNWLRPFGQIGVISLVCLVVVLFSIWPNITGGPTWSAWKLHIYHFAIWGLLIILAFVIGVFLTPPAGRQPPEDD